MQPAPRTALYPDTAAHERFDLPVSHGHVLAVGQWGRADGIPALVLHGGPGSSVTPILRRWFDPARYRIVGFDQRGAGSSRPAGDIEHNDTGLLLQDLRALREHLGIERWLVVGGSWGATLAVAYAAAEPAAVTGLLLRASFLARDEDVDWFFHGVAPLRPEAWARFTRGVPPAHQADMLGWLADALFGDDEAARRDAARRWSAWEQAVATGQLVDPPAGGCADVGTADARLLARYRVQAHYLRHGCWLRAPTLLERCAAVPPVPIHLLHARDDLVCRAEGATALHAALQAATGRATLQWLPAGGHDPTHPDMVAGMVGALDRFADGGEFAART